MTQAVIKSPAMERLNAHLRMSPRMSRLAVALMFIAVPTLLSGCDDAEEETRTDQQEVRELFSEDGSLSIALPPKIEPEPPPPPLPPVEQIIEPPPPDPGVATVDAQRIDFGRQTVTEEQSARNQVRQFEIRFSSGETPVQVFSVVTDRSDLFLIETCPEINLSPENRSCRVNVTFQPTQGNFGDYSGTISVTLIESGQSRTISLPAVAVVQRARTAAPPPPPPPPPVISNAPVFDAVAALRLQRVSSSGETLLKAAARDVRPDPFDKFEMSDPDYAEKWNQPRLDSGYPVDQTRMISKFRTISALLETPINSAIESKFIATIARNVYGGAGENRYVLFPAGTKIIGWNGSLEKVGDSRLPVIITDIERPDGARVVIEAAGHDQMGRPGLIGVVDNRLWERFGASGIVAVISTLTAIAVQGGTDERLVAGQQELADSLSEIGSRILEDTIDLAPIMSIAGGARISLMLGEDIWFPEARRIVVGNPDQLVEVAKTKN